jgi:putative DNA primase/helicase
MGQVASLGWKRWTIDRTIAVHNLARNLVREVAKGQDAKLIARIESAATVNAIVALARADRAHARVTEDFDSDAWVLNTPAGTYELLTGTMRPHRREDGIMKITSRPRASRTRSTGPPA